MKYMEVDRPLGDGRCSDDDCPCGELGVTIPRGEGYLYISKEVVEIRTDCPTLREAQEKIQRMRPGAFILTAQGVFTPVLMCEQGARKRGLNLEVAAADAKHWWETGLVPLRPTPIVSRTELEPEAVEGKSESREQRWYDKDKIAVFGLTPSREAQVKIVRDYQQGRAAPGITKGVYDLAWYDLALSSTARTLLDGEKERSAVALVIGMAHEDSEMRSLVSELLGNIDRNWRESEAAVRAIPFLTLALKGKKSANTLPELALRDIDPTLAKELLQSIDPHWTRSNGARVVVPELIAALAGEDSDVKFNVVTALGELGDARAVDALTNALKDMDPKIRRAAARALGDTREIRAAKPLIAALGDKDSGVRQNASIALRDGVGGKAIDPLIKDGLLSRSPGVRAQAKETLDQIDAGWRNGKGAENCLPVLIRRLKDNDGSERARAALALGVVKHRGAVEPLIEVLNDRERRVQVEVVIALHEIGDERSIGPLKALAARRRGFLDVLLFRPNVQEYARKALAELQAASTASKQ